MTIKMLEKDNGLLRIIHGQVLIGKGEARERWKERMRKKE